MALGRAAGSRAGHPGCDLSILVRSQNVDLDVMCRAEYRWIMSSSGRNSLSPARNYTRILRQTKPCNHHSFMTREISMYINHSSYTPYLYPYESGHGNSWLQPICALEKSISVVLLATVPYPAQLPHA